MSNFLGSLHTVFVADQPYLEDHGDEWLPRIQQEGGIYINAAITNGNDAERMIDIAEKHHLDIEYLGMIYDRPVYALLPAP